MPKRLALILLAAAVLAAGAYHFVSSHPDMQALAPLRALLARAAPGTVPTAPAPAPAPAPTVGVLEVRPAEVPLPVEYAGRVVGFRDVEVRSRVGGLLLKREFEEGAKVQQGQILFRIDPATYRVALDRSLAQLAQAQAQLRQADENYARVEELARRQVSTGRQLDEARAQRDLGRAAVELAQAEIEAAKLNSGYTTITAPVTGVTSLESPPEGTLIQAQQTLLTTVSQLDPAYVNFSFTDADNQAFRALNENRAKPITIADLAVELRYGSGSVYPQPGRIDIAAQRVDPQTGTLQARVIFPNANGVLLPGQFVRVVVRGITLLDALLIPEAAISQGPQGPSVYVLEANDIAQSHPVRLGQRVAAGYVVQEGLRAGDRVVVDGLLRVRPGAPVKPVPAAAPSAPARQVSQQQAPSGAGSPPAAGTGARP